MEIHISAASPGPYQVVLKFNDLASQGLNPPVQGRCGIVPEELWKLVKDPPAYGEKLSEGVFRSDDKILAEFRRVKTVRESRTGAHLRMSLVIEPDALELQAVAWELLTDPDTKACIATDVNTPFSRFLYGRDSAAIPPLPKSHLKALIAVPNPTNWDFWGLTPVGAPEVVSTAKEALKDVQIIVMEGPVTLDALVNEIRTGYDLLYLVCHGEMVKPDKSSTPYDYESGFGLDPNTTLKQGIKLPYLWLENDQRQLESVSGGLFARKLKDLGVPLPRLMVLVSCESAGAQGDWTGQAAQASLAPRLARAGVPALIAMQGKIKMDTANPFIKAFFADLIQHGSIDQAVAVGRGEIRDKPGSWMPALFLRLKDGRLWIEPGFAPGADFNLDTIAGQVVAKKGTPILGWGLAERIYGTKAGLSQRLAEEKQVPLQPHRLGELAMVSQYLQKTSSDTDALDSLKDRMKLEILALFKEGLAPDLREEGLSTVLDAAGGVLRGSENDLYGIVAQMPFSVYLNACPDTLLTEALKAQKKEPVILTPRWRSNFQWQVRSCSDLETVTQVNPTDLNPNPMKPLVVHIFGHFVDEATLVLGEDDYLNFLIAMAQNQSLLPGAVKDALADQPLLFLGFQMTDWSFRVLFRLVVGLMAGATNRQANNKNVAVQVEPDGSLFAGPEEAKFYLQKFYDPCNIQPFWGTSEDFLRELWAKVKGPLAKKAHGKF